MKLEDLKPGQKFHTQLDEKGPCPRGRSLVELQAAARSQHLSYTFWTSHSQCRSSITLLPRAVASPWRFSPGHRVLAVLSRRVDGWCVYIDAVPGVSHDDEWRDVARFGDKQKEEVARAIATSLFYPPFDPGDLPYAH